MKLAPPPLWLEKKPNEIPKRWVLRLKPVADSGNFFHPLYPNNIPFKGNISHDNFISGLHQFPQLKDANIFVADLDSLGGATRIPGSIIS